MIAAGAAAAGLALFLTRGMAVPPLVAVMGDAYPELREKMGFIRSVLLKEGEQFARTLATGMGLLDEAISLAGNKPSKVLMVNRGLAEMPLTAGRDIDIEVDGGINFATAGECAHAGADTFVSGTGLFRQHNMRAAVAKMRKLVQQHGHAHRHKSAAPVAA